MSIFPFIFIISLFLLPTGRALSEDETRAPQQKWHCLQDARDRKKDGAGY